MQNVACVHALFLTGDKCGKRRMRCEGRAGRGETGRTRTAPLLSNFDSDFFFLEQQCYVRFERVFVTLMLDSCCSVS